jgi:hypothetical protein
MQTNHKQSFLATVFFCALVFTATIARATDFRGRVQGVNQPIAGSTVTLFAASTSAPRRLAQGRTDDSDLFLAG